MAVALGGRIAEELIFGDEDITTGASGDFQQARAAACSACSVCSVLCLQKRCCRGCLAGSLRGGCVLPWGRGPALAPPLP
jgi:hypothetical protein